MGSRSWRAVGLAIAGALAFGVGMSVLKGNDGGAVRGAVANLSAPWLLLPFVAGATAGGGRVGRAALVGLLVSFVALAGFYVANSFVLHLGPHPWLVDLRLAFGDGYFFKFALLSGPAFGALGARWQLTRSRPLGVLVAALFVFEPFAWLAYYGGLYTSDASVWAVEVVAGLAACALLVARPRRPPVS
jgi:hypothetical protein